MGGEKFRSPEIGDIPAPETGETTNEQPRPAAEQLVVEPSEALETPDLTASAEEVGVSEPNSGPDSETEPITDLEASVGTTPTTIEEIRHLQTALNKSMTEQI